MKARVVIVVLLASLLWPASLVALAQPSPSSADRPQRVSNRDHPSTFRGPAPLQGGSLERWTFSRRAHFGSSVRVKASDGLSNPGRKAGATAIARGRDHPSTYQGPPPMQGGSLERWPLARRAH